MGSGAGAFAFARHFWRANWFLPSLSPCRWLFQSAPAISGGRIRLLVTAQQAADVVSIRARHFWRANPFACNALLGNGFYWHLRELRHAKLFLYTQPPPSHKKPNENKALRSARTSQGKSVHWRIALRVMVRHSMCCAGHSTSGPSKSVALNVPCSITSKPRVPGMR